MDLRLTGADPTAAEVSAVDAVLGPAPKPDGRVHRAGPAGGPGRDLLLPALHALDQRVGWISPGGLDYVCSRLDVAPADAYGVASFYAMFSLRPRPSRVVHVCTDIACLAEPPPVGGDEVVVVPSPCLGLCERAPAALVVQAGEEPYAAPFAPADAEAIVAVAAGSRPPAWDVAASVPQRTGREPWGGTGADDGAASPELPEPVLLARVGRVDPSSIGEFRASGGFEGLRRAFELGPAAVLDEIVASGLVGRGGAAFPAGRKWEAVARAPARPHYVVANADESEPGTFKDRVLLEGDPFALVEALTIAGFATGSERGFVYLRGEYPVAFERLSHAVEEATRHGFLGTDVMGRGFAFDLQIRRGAGAYICGEETALFASIEGYRGEPRSKPPFPTEVGLFGKPTAVGNVETLANVAHILRRGASAFAASETKLFCVSGAVSRPGCYELPLGTPLRTLLERAGAPSDVQAVLLGGAAGTFVAPEQFDLALSFDGARAAGATLGSGVVMVFDRSADLSVVLRRIAAFFRDESCGQCVPCRVGTVRQEEVLARLAAGRPLGGDVAGELALLDELARAMRDASICGLGHTAPNAIESALRTFNPFGARS